MPRAVGSESVGVSFPLRAARAGPLLVLLLLCTGGCARMAPMLRATEDTSLAPNALWKPPSVPGPPAAPHTPSPIPPELQGQTWGLPDVVGLALRNNPATRAAWYAARAAASQVGVARGAYFPQVNADGSLSFSESYDSQAKTLTDLTSVAPSASLSWLLFDFGARTASVESARQTLAAANWSHNQVLQDTVLQAAQGYFGYMASKALAVARRQSLKDAELQLDVAERRHDAGVATIADVLQAKTSVAQARLALQTADGLIQTTRGGLAAAMGLPANLAFDIEEPPGRVPLEGISQKVDDLIQQALSGRAQLAAARAQVLASEADVRQSEANGYPTLTLSADVSRTYFDKALLGATGSGDRYQDDYGAGLQLHFPLFTGFSYTYGVKRAKAQAEATRAGAQGQEQQVILQVYTAYHALRTATEQVRTSDELLTNAEQSEAVALGRYKEGVGTILDVVTAQTALADARAQVVQARFAWYSSLAQLSHDTGLLDLDGKTPLYQAPSPSSGRQQDKR